MANIREVEIGQILQIGEITYQWINQGEGVTTHILAGRHPDSLTQEDQKTPLPMRGGAIGSERFDGPAIPGPALSPADAESILSRAEYGFMPRTHLVDRAAAAIAHAR